MLLETTPHVLTEHTNGQLQHTNGQLQHIVSLANETDSQEFPREIPEPDYQVIDDCLALLTRISDSIDEMEEPLSDGHHRFLKASSIMLSLLANRIDEHREFIISLSGNVPWKKKISDRLVDLANEIEDVAEVCELSSDEDFIKMIKGRLQSYLNASSKN